MYGDTRLAIFIIEVVFSIERENKRPILIHDVVCVKSSLGSALIFLKRYGIRDGWEEPIYEESKFECYMISHEYLDQEDGPQEVYYYNNRFERIMNIKDHRPYKEDGYPN